MTAYDGITAYYMGLVVNVYYVGYMGTLVHGLVEDEGQSIFFIHLKRGINYEQYSSRYLRNTYQ